MDLKQYSRRDCVDDDCMRAFDQMILDGADANVRTVYYLTVQNAVIGGIAKAALMAALAPNKNDSGFDHEMSYLE